MNLFNNPLFLGFDNFERTLSRLSKFQNENYPPYNIELIGDAKIEITLAIAGFDLEDIQISLQDNQLIIKGEKQEDSERVFLHRGIATRQFQKIFLIADGIEVTDASFINGLLKIQLLRPKMITQVRNIPIRDGSLANHSYSLVTLK